MELKQIFLLLAFCLTSSTLHCVHCDEELLEPALKRWISFHRWSTRRIEDLLDRYLPEIEEVTRELNPSCSESIYEVLDGLRGLKKWAFRMVDASAFPPSGILDGTLADLGTMDVCFTVQHHDLKGDLRFKGQHCAVDLMPALPPKPRHVAVRTKVIDLTNHVANDSVFIELTEKAAFFYRIAFRMGLCIPSTCSTNDLEVILSKVLKDTFFEVTVPYCQQNEPWTPDTSQIAVMMIIALLFILVIVGSVVHQKVPAPKEESDERTAIRVIRCFSLSKSYKKMTEDSENRTLDCLDGIRVICMLWIVLVHTYAFQHEKSLGNVMYVIGFADVLSFGVVLNAWVSVDGFFTIGGVLVAYTTIRSIKKKNGQFEVTRFVLRRIWRLFPAVYVATAALFLMPLMDRGPNYPETMGAEYGRCQYLWWMPLLLLNTWGDFKDNCMIHTWYVSADLHLYVMAALPVYLLYKRPRVGVVFCILQVLASVGLTGLITYIYDLYPGILFVSPDLEAISAVGSMVQLRPYGHVAPYVIGVLIGYLLTKEQGEVKSQLLKVTGWLTSVALMLFVLLGAYKWHNGQDIDRLESAVYAAVHRGCWGLAIGWIVYACSTNNDWGLVRPVLAWRFFRRLAPLTYLMYLLHLVAIWQRNAARRERFYLKHYDYIYEFFGNTVCAFGGAFVCHLLVEAPFAALDKVIFPDKHQNKANGQVIEQINSAEIMQPETTANEDAGKSSQDGQLRVEKKDEFMSFSASGEDCTLVAETRGQGEKERAQKDGGNPLAEVIGHEVVEETPLIDLKDQDVLHLPCITETNSSPGKITTSSSQPYINGADIQPASDL